MYKRQVVEGLDAELVDLGEVYHGVAVERVEVDELGVQTLNDGSAEVRVVRPLGTRGSQATQTLSLSLLHI